VAWRGKKIGGRSGDEFFDVGAQGGLVVFDGQQIVGAVFRAPVPGGLVLGVESVEADFAPVQIELFEQLARDRISLVLTSTIALPRKYWLARSRR
jgi:hypothetical protein